MSSISPGLFLLGTGEGARGPWWDTAGATPIRLPSAGTIRRSVAFLIARACLDNGAPELAPALLILERATPDRLGHTALVH